MHSSTSSSDRARSAERLTAADRPGVAQPVPERPVPAQPWRRLIVIALVIVVALTALWEWRMRTLVLLPGDLEDGPSDWAAARRVVDRGDVDIAIVGDSRILFDTDLAHFQALTGTRPLQLALRGTNARPFLEDLAADPDFRGLAIVGIAEQSFFREGLGRGADALPRYRHESPSQRGSFVLHRALSRVFGFLDEDYRLSKLVERLDRGVRRGARSPYDDVWKISTFGDDRQMFMWSRIETDPFLREHARLWRGMLARAPALGDPPITMTLARSRAAVDAIRARGGDVVFVRPPSAPLLRPLEERVLPRAKGWDALLAATATKGLHADDDPVARVLTLPEDSHLSRACARVYTDRYVRQLAALTPRVVIRPDAPPPLAAADCGA